MTAITREYLDALAERATRALNNPNGQQYDAAVLLASDLPASIDTLRRVLDLRDEYERTASTDAERLLTLQLTRYLAGTQTDDGASPEMEASPPTVAGSRSAPSSPDRIEAVAESMMDHPVSLVGWCPECREHVGTAPLHLARHYARLSVAALDAYDRDRGIVRTPDYLVGRGGPVVVDTAGMEADLRERIAAEIEHGIDGRTGAAIKAWDEACRRAARIVRGQS